MAAKLKLKPDPFFRAPVPIPIPGSDPVNVEMVFKHRTRTELDEWVRTREGKSDIDTFMDMVIGWDFEDEFTKENADALIESRMGTAVAAYTVYLTELVGRPKEKARG